MDAFGFVGKSTQHRSGKGGEHMVLAQLAALSVRTDHDDTTAPTIALPIRRKAWARDIGVADNLARSSRSD
jgi:hypothetical protein